jgi:hypothetical protein
MQARLPKYLAIYTVILSLAVFYSPGSVINFADSITTTSMAMDASLYPGGFSNSPKGNNVTEVGKLHMLCIGITQYDFIDQFPVLPYSTADADTVYHLFKSQAEKMCLYKGGLGYTDLLNNTNTNKEDIMAALDSISVNVKANDIFVFYFSGHGTVLGESFALAPKEGDIGNEETLIFKDELFTKFDNILSAKLIFIDACYSANAADPNIKAGPESENSLAQSLFNDAVLALNKPTVIIASSMRGAFQAKDLKHSLFTYALIQALKKQSVNGLKPNSGFLENYLTVDELDGFIKLVVPSVLNDPKYRQEVFSLRAMGTDFPIFSYDCKK